MRRAALWFVSAGLLALALSGCALPRMIDSDVQSYVGTVPAVSNASFRFDQGHVGCARLGRSDKVPCLHKILD